MSFDPPVQVAIAVIGLVGLRDQASARPPDSPRHECESYEHFCVAEEFPAEWTGPNDVPAGLGIYQPDGNRIRQVAATGTSAPSQTIVLDAGEIPAGEYFLKASTASFAGGMAVSEGDEPHPPHFGSGIAPIWWTPRKA